MSDDSVSFVARPRVLGGAVDLECDARGATDGVMWDAYEVQEMVVYI